MTDNRPEKVEPETASKFGGMHRVRNRHPMCCEVLND